VSENAPPFCTQSSLDTTFARRNERMNEKAIGKTKPKASSLETTA
jgi:hypothetical protein